MLSFHLIVFMWAVSAVCGQDPSTGLTKDHICRHPTISSGLTVYSKDKSKHRTYLFYGPFRMKYDFNLQQIDWQNIKLDKQLFPNVNQQNQWSLGITLAVWHKNKVYVNFKASDNVMIYDYNFTTDYFKQRGSQDFSKTPFEVIKWTITTIDGNRSDKKTMYFMDKNTVSSTNQIISKSYPYGNKGSITFGHMKNTKSNIRLHDEVFPNTIVYTQSVTKNKIKIPVEFDGYYLTHSNETVFFKGETVCINYPKPKDLLNEYCHTFADTRHIIGCSSNPSNYLNVPEVFEGEPVDDIYPDI